MKVADNIKKIKLVECPRDALQGWPHLFLRKKRSLISTNCSRWDSTASISEALFLPKQFLKWPIPKRWVNRIFAGNSKTRLLAIVANTRGAVEAAMHPQIQDIGFPFSISESFQQRNTNSSIADSVRTVFAMMDICRLQNKRLVIYISMAFGNPYGDEWSPSIAIHHIGQLVKMGVEVISLADTVGLADPDQVFDLTRALITEFPQVEAGVHLHSRRENSIGKLDAAYNAGCLRFDGALNGIGGCPMAGDDLVGNMDSLLMIDHFREKEVLPELSEEALQKSRILSAEIFLNH